MGLQIFGQRVRYMPEYGENRKTDTPAFVMIRPMTSAEFRKHATEKAAGAQENAEFALATIDEVVGSHVVEVNGITLRSWGEDGSDGHCACSVQDLVSWGPRELMLELYEAIVNSSKLSEGVEKKSS